MHRVSRSARRCVLFIFRACGAISSGLTAVSCMIFNRGGYSVPFVIVTIGVTSPGPIALSVVGSSAHLVGAGIPWSDTCVVSGSDLLVCYTYATCSHSSDLKTHKGDFAGRMFE